MLRRMSPSPDQRVAALASRQHGVVTTAQALSQGLTRNQLTGRLRAGRYRGLWRGVVWVWPNGDQPSWITLVQAALLLHGDRAVAALGTAADLQGIAGHDTGVRDVHLVVPRGVVRQQRRGIILHFWDVPPATITRISGIRCTNPQRTLADLVPRLQRNPAVSVLDSALHQGLLSPTDVAAAQQLAAWRPGAKASAGWWSLADSRSASPLETWARLDCSDARMAPDELQWPVRNEAGELLGIGDMAWLGRHRPLVAEADGADPHSQPAALFRDRWRANNFVSAGVDVVRLTWTDARQPGRCATIVRQALATEPDDLGRRLKGD